MTPGYCVKSAIFVHREHPLAPVEDGMQAKIVSLIADDHREELLALGGPCGASEMISEVMSFSSWEEAAFTLGPIRYRLHERLQSCDKISEQRGDAPVHFLAFTESDLNLAISFFRRRPVGRPPKREMPRFLNNSPRVQRREFVEIWEKCQVIDRKFYERNIATLPEEGNDRSEMHRWSPLHNARRRGLDRHAELIVLLYDLLRNNNSSRLDDELLLWIAWDLAVAIEAAQNHRLPRRWRTAQIGVSSLGTYQFDHIPDFVDEDVSPKDEIRRCAAIINHMPTARFSIAALGQLSDQTRKLLEPELLNALQMRGLNVPTDTHFDHELNAGDILEACRRTMSRPALNSRPNRTAANSAAAAVGSAWCRITGLGPNSNGVEDFFFAINKLCPGLHLSSKRPLRHLGERAKL